MNNERTFTFSQCISIANQFMRAAFQYAHHTNRNGKMNFQYHSERASHWFLLAEKAQRQETVTPLYGMKPPEHWII